jgi:mono/diheme cytochrome c family protein
VSVIAVIIIMVVITLTWSAEASSTATEPTIEEGQKIYQLICVACHDPDPNVDRVGGTYGPPIAGSSLKLLELRVLGTVYPEGYTPKRDTNLMTPFPLNRTQIGSLHLFLTDAKDPDK